VRDGSRTSVEAQGFVPSTDPGGGRRISEKERHPGALFFGYFLLRKQKKVTRRRAETRIKNKLPR
jgi:hypothetical protein